MHEPPKRVAIALIIAIVLAIGWLMLVVTMKATPSKQPTVTRTVITHSTTAPSESPIDASSYTWNGEVTDPKYISLPTINTEGFIQQVGVDQNKQIAVPTNVHLAGWYVDSVAPGKPGLSIIDGHIVADGKSQGIFQHLSDLQKNDSFTVAFGSGATQKFVVDSVQTIPLSTVPEVLFSQNPAIKNQLNLVTCGGQYDKSAKEFTHRVVVVSHAEA